jgi:hypothetical protein
MVETRPAENGGEARRCVRIDPPLACAEVQIERGGEAWQAWEHYARAVTFDLLKEGEVPRQFHPSYGRMGTILIKVAMILAAFDAESPPVRIAPCHVYRAQQIVEHWRRSLHHIFGNLAQEQAGGTEERVKAVLARKKKEWTTRRDLLRGLNCKWSSISVAVNRLVARGEVERREHKRSEAYRLVAR